MNRNRLMRADELHKFNDGMLDDVRSALNDIAKGIRMEYLPMRKWSNLDKKRARVMVQDIDKQLYQRRLMRNLEEVRWWKGIRERSQATGKDNMTLSYFVSTHFSQNQRDLLRDIPLDSVVVLRYEKRSKSKNKGKVPTEMELVLEQNQQSAAAKPSQRDSSEFYLITGSIYTE
ncbi:hypothetical protein Tco_0675885 [Tanacetum coccineum]